jgi:prophage regulatory protein
MVFITPTICGQKMNKKLKAPIIRKHGAQTHGPMISTFQHSGSSRRRVMAMTETPTTVLSVFLRLPQVLEIIPISKSTWWAGIRSGKFPKPVKLTERTSAWRRKDIEDLCVRLSGTDGIEAGR